MPTQDQERLALLQGTLDLLILRTLLFGREHGQGIARSIEQNAQDNLLVDHGALYPALQRLRQRGWVAAEWRRTPNNQRARYYTITPNGRKQLGIEEESFAEIFEAIRRVLRSV